MTETGHLNKGEYVICLSTGRTIDWTSEIWEDIKTDSIEECPECGEPWEFDDQQPVRDEK